MCGIVGILGLGDVAPRLVDALKRLEYRGYDSAGVATLENGKLARRRAEGKLRNLEAALEKTPIGGTSGIGHTRWATHGGPSVMNAHPHLTGHVAVVHNGIIENYLALRDEIKAAGADILTETDTEVVAHLVNEQLASGLAPQEAVAAILPRLNGAFALAFLFDGAEDLMIGARKGSPLAIGHGDGELYFGSDAIALSPFTDRITYLEEGDWAVATRAGVTIYNESNEEVCRPESKSSVTSSLMDKGNYRHFMAKEMHEQPEVIGHTLSRYINPSARKAAIEGIDLVDFAGIQRIILSACGTGYLAALIGKYWFEKYARLPVEIDFASELRYREAPVSDKDFALFISQSGETADTLAALRYCKQEGARVGSIVNVPESTIARESDVFFQTMAGPEICVASTKAFTCQLAVLAALAVQAGRLRGVLNEEQEGALIDTLASVPGYAVQALKCESAIEPLAHKLSRATSALYLGRNTNFPLALEGALKLKELSYIHAEGYAAGELKHGPIALIDETMPVVVLAPYDGIFEKTVSNMQEVAARGGKIILITDQKGADASVDTEKDLIVLPDVPDFIAPIIYAIPVQLLAYHTAVFMGTDVDQPRNLAKSVTVE
ncbi:glutamine--fructose-6-phosphate transaminase (isomerizing) [Roseibium algae]|uniref:Glutamine--fructose-6-phosphate aminotransferase [isomerizing] n=1 Tax=Roseibium algae TaxID=3123038 RepID=A0ABU8TN34_9HYPH